MTDAAVTIAALRERLAVLTGADRDEFLRMLADDHRAGAQALLVSARASALRDDAEESRLSRMMDVQRALHERGFVVVAGVDEVGRGALAGPVTAGAVILPVEVRIKGLNDSKRLSRHAREMVASRVREQAVAWSVAHVHSGEIDRIGIGPATRLAWRRALDGLGTPVDHIVIDGNDARGLGTSVTALVRGDALVSAIAAASVVAKVTRDALMEVLAAEHPGYGLEGNRGYGSPEHIERIRAVGPSGAHRRTFAPCCEWDRLF